MMGAVDGAVGSGPVGASLPVMQVECVGCEELRCACLFEQVLGLRHRGSCFRH